MGADGNESSNRFEKHVPPRKFGKFITDVQLNFEEKQRVESGQGRSAQA